MGNTYFVLKILSRVARGQDKVEVINMIHLVLAKKDMLHYAQNVRAVRGMR